MNRLVSIITVSYNSEKTIAESINSVLDQTYKRIEYIIIDGASTDRTVSIIRKYEKKALDSGVEYQWVSESDKGIYDAMNKGLSMANGDIIGILNSDDAYSKDAIQTLMKYLPEDHRRSVYHGEIQKIDARGNLLFLSNKGEIKSRKQVCNQMPINHPATFVGSDVYETIGFYNTRYKLSADYEFVVRAYTSGTPFIYIDHVLTSMRIQGDSEKVSNLLIQLKEDYTIKQQFFRELKFLAIKKYITAYSKYLIKSLTDSVFGTRRYTFFLKNFYSRKRCK